MNLKNTLFFCFNYIPDTGMGLPKTADNVYYGVSLSTLGQGSEVIVMKQECMLLIEFPQTNRLV